MARNTADSGPAAQLVQASGPAEIMRASPTPSGLPSWHNGSMIVIGDAAHAPTPTSGQGASLSIEDAVVLAQCLRDLPAPASSSSSNRPPASTAAKTTGPIARALRDAILPAVMKIAANGKQATAAYRYHIDWDASVTA